MTAKVQPAEVAHYKSLGARDVIAKPFDPWPWRARFGQSGRHSVVTPPSHVQTVAEQLARLRNDYLVRLPAELAALTALAIGLGEGEPERAGLDELHHRLHKLAGSGGTFGFAALSAAARTLEQRVKAFLSNPLEALDSPSRLAFLADVAALGETVIEDDAPLALSTASVEPAPGESIQICWLRMTPCWGRNWHARSKPSNMLCGCSPRLVRLSVLHKRIGPIC